MSTRVPFVTLHVAMNHRRYIGCTVYWVVPFNHTGCNCNVTGGIIAAPTGVIPLRPLFLQCTTPYCASSTAYGGPPSPKGKVLGVVPFIRRGDIRNAPGTAHRPFPTVSLVGGFLQPHRLYSERGGRQIAAPTDTPVCNSIHPHGLFSQRPRNGTQAVPYGFAGRSVFSTTVI